MIILIGVIGTSGYSQIEGLTIIDALYMTVITVSTVGFREVHELSDNGKLFTILLIVFSLGIFTYAITTLTSLIIEGQLMNIIKGYRIKKRYKMENHIIVVGYGRNGQQVVKELIAHDNKYVVIDNNVDVIGAQENKIIQMLSGDATNDDTLVRAGVKSAKAMITTLPLDADNLFVVLTARSLNQQLTIISRASNVSSEKKLRIAGVNNVVMPEKVGGAHMANLVARPDVIDFLDHLSIHGAAPTNLEEIVCSCIHENYLNKSIFEIGIRKKTGANIIGYKTTEGEFILNPDPETKVIKGSKLFVLGTHEQTNKMKELLSNCN